MLGKSQHVEFNTIFKWFAYVELESERERKRESRAGGHHSKGVPDSARCRWRLSAITEQFEIIAADLVFQSEKSMDCL